jgi:Predicted Fe-S oxidoreductases
MNIKVLCAHQTCTYFLGKSLYIPLTSRSNCCTLPETRGPGFKLPRSVVASLLRVRDYETRNGNNIKTGDILANDRTTTESKEENEERQHISSSQEEKIKLPKNSYSRVPSSPLLNDEQLYPTSDMILSEVQQYCKAKEPPQSIVFAGEGEPTLRLQTLMKLSEKIKYNGMIYKGDCSIRIVTNGLVLANLGHQSRKILEQLKSKGVDGLSIALMTSCPGGYIDLMQPYTCRVEDKTMKMSGERDAHEKVCELIQNAVEIGFHVECTGVDRSSVDKKMAENLAKELGAHSFRWRPYFP